MDEKEMETTLPDADDTVPDTPPEPEAPKDGESVLEEYPYEAAPEKEEEEAREEPPISGDESKENAHSETDSASYHYGETPQPETPPFGYHYEGDSRQGMPPPNYGSGYQQGYPPKKTNGMALASLILGILSIVMCCCGGFGVILGAVGIVLAILSHGGEPMETNAKAGLCLSVGGIVLGIVVLVLAFVVVSQEGLQSELYHRGQRNYEDYSHYFEHNGL